MRARSIAAGPEPRGLRHRVPRWASFVAQVRYLTCMRSANGPLEEDEAVWVEDGEVANEGRGGEGGE